jgi:uncharacterized membrane protein
MARPPHHPPRTDDHQGDGAIRSTQRMEAFADGVFAIAFTLPVVELELPEVREELWGELGRISPSYLGFGLAAGVIGLFWVHHHFSGAIYRTVGHWFNLATLLFLASIAFIAFPARVLAEHIHDPADFPGAARFFTIALAVTTLAWSLKWTVGRVSGGVDDRLDPTYVRRLNLIYLGSSGLMTLAAALTFVAPWTGLVMALTIVLAYLIPPQTPVYIAEAPVVEGEG